ncbi:cytochrome P450 alkane hydroxylase like protein [Zymoseptoria brevis]|uniref:Cytochrome P450 alkane hydroxylase like protein n=1 Tax=Zymoseptoria brevis TaxID=1047168 RepID=A0A0F4GR93_9PEZI|nr:cytochrome P450 alkane hydroxylase like protein [Zymoseptoria brevis]
MFSGATVGNVLLLFALIYVAYRYTASAAKYREDVRYGDQHGCKPPTWVMPYKLPLALDVLKKGFHAGRQKRLLAMFDQYFDTLGPTVEVSILAGKGYATMDPANIEAIPSTRFQDFHLGPRSVAMKAMIGEGIFTQNLDGFQEHIEYLISTLRGANPGVVDLQPLFFRLTLNTTIAMILGQPVESFNHDIGDQFSRSFNKASLVTATRVRLGDLGFLYAPRGFYQACKTVKDYTQKFVQDALQSDTSAKDSCPETLIGVMNEEYQDPDLIRDQVINILIAGRDTTATTMSYAIRLLTRHPEKLQILRAEISDVLGNDLVITRAKVQRMHYLQSVIRETLRLYPPVPINTRFCKRATHLPFGGGPDGQFPLLIRENMPVAYSVYHMQRRRDIYGEDALSFRPERWDDELLTNVKWAYLPFNGGPRRTLA